MQRTTHRIHPGRSHAHSSSLIDHRIGAAPCGRPSPLSSRSGGHEPAGRSAGPPLPPVLKGRRPLASCSPIVHGRALFARYPASRTRPKEEKISASTPRSFSTPVISPRLPQDFRRFTQICPSLTANAQNFQTPSQSPVLSLGEASSCEPRDSSRELHHPATPFPISAHRHPITIPPGGLPHPSKETS